MVKNIVFDMGKVLTDYVPDAVCRHYIKDEAMIRKISDAVFVSPEWVLLDLGVVPEDEGLRRITERLDTPQEKEWAAQCFWHWHEYNMWHMEGMEELVRSLKAAGYGIYLCSNASVRLLTCWQKVIPAADCFDGILFSGPEKCMKPQKEIYERLFARFSLKPEECLFIDDQPLNIQGAAECGMRGYVYDGDREKLKQWLSQELWKNFS